MANTALAHTSFPERLWLNSLDKDTTYACFCSRSHSGIPPTYGSVLRSVKTKSSVSLSKIMDSILVVPKSSKLQCKRIISDQCPKQSAKQGTYALSKITDGGCNVLQTNYLYI